ncbi:MAG: haloacid dehalogenase type II [Pseudomonadota bacterium]|nr:haloacid dehalogenase type II [Pseudomonadota bacterium]
MPAPPPDGSAVRALVFDVFGTVVDWRGTIIREGEALAAAKGWHVDWPAFADAWRAGYQPAMRRAMQSAPTGEVAWANIDLLHRAILDTLLPRFGLDRLAEEERVRLNLVWHRLDPWPDVVPGLLHLKACLPIATLSNGNVSLLVDMARHAKLPWDCVLSAELFRRYKPDPAVYLGAAALLGVAPGELLMVAAHPSDLAAAHGAGLKTAYVERPLEHGADGPREAAAGQRFDWVGRDFVDLALQLGA